MARKQRFYVVWRGRECGIFTSWSDTEAQVKGYSGARHKSFTSLAEAESAYSNGPPETWAKPVLDSLNLQEQSARDNANIGRQVDLPF